VELNLGMWQSRRAAEKEAIAAKMAERMHSPATQWRSDTPEGAITAFQ
jgi:cytochrome oxidase assembly protein ShyY1